MFPGAEHPGLARSQGHNRVAIAEQDGVRALHPGGWMRCAGLGGEATVRSAMSASNDTTDTKEKGQKLLDRLARV